MQRLSIRVLGRPEVLLDGQPAKFPTRKALALLIYLVVTGEIHSREKLMALLWPDSTTSAAQASLRNTLARLRTTLGEAGAMVIATSDAIGIDPGADFELDLRAVSAAVAAIRTTSQLPTPPCFKLRSRPTGVSSWPSSTSPTRLTSITGSWSSASTGIDSSR